MKGKGNETLNAHAAGYRNSSEPIKSWSTSSERGKFAMLDLIQRHGIDPARTSYEDGEVSNSGDADRDCRAVVTVA